MGITLKAARINKNMSQKDAAKQIGVTAETLGNWEKSKTYPDIIQVKKMERLYGVPYDDLVFYNETSV